MIDHKAELSCGCQASENPVDRLFQARIFLRLYSQDQHPVLPRFLIGHTDPVLLQFSTRDFILKSAVGYAGNAL